MIALKVFIFERFYWSLAHPWYFSEKSLGYVLNKLDQPFEILLEQRYDLSNHMVWAKDGVPGGMGKLTHLLGEELENDYKNNLIKIGKCLFDVVQNQCYFLK